MWSSLLSGIKRTHANLGTKGLEKTSDKLYKGRLEVEKHSVGRRPEKGGAQPDPQSIQNAPKNLIYAPGAYT